MGFESLEDERLAALRKRGTSDVHGRALQLARWLGMKVAITGIADPD